MTVVGSNPEGVVLTAEQLAELISTAVATGIAVALKPLTDRLEDVSQKLDRLPAGKPWDGESV